MLRPTDDIEDDPRFLQGIELLNMEEYFEASDFFEELFFESVGDEVDFIRFFLQLSVGLLHAERHQWRAAGERLREGILALDRVKDTRGIDRLLVRQEVSTAIEKATQHVAHGVFVEIKKTRS